MKLNERAMLADAILKLQDNLTKGIAEVASALAFADSRNETGFTSEYLRNVRRNPADINKVSKDFGSHVAVLEHKNYQTKLKLIDKETELVSLECFVKSYEEAEEKIQEHLAKLVKTILVVMVSAKGGIIIYSLVTTLTFNINKDTTIDSRDNGLNAASARMLISDLEKKGALYSLSGINKLLSGKEPHYTLTLIVE